MDDHADLIFGFHGRIGRRPYWAGWAYVAGLSIIFGALSIIIADAADLHLSGLKVFPMSLIVFAMKTVVLFPLAAVMVKRLHDRNKSGYHAAFSVGWLWLNDLTDFIGITGDPATASVPEAVFSLGAVAVFLFYTVELGFLRGTAGPNAYGPDPLARAGGDLQSCDG